MGAMSTEQAKTMLKAIGFDNAARDFPTAVRGFQTGWNLGAALSVDGKFGPLTSAALATSFARHRQGKPTMSAHFSYVEFQCKCGGRFSDCQRIWEKREHVRRLEAYRASVRAPVRIASGCRCEGHNRAVGGAAASQHLFGASSDLVGLVSLSKMASFKLFAGLGFQRSTGRVVHADSRDISGHKPSGGEPSAPTTWQYNS